MYSRAYFHIGSLLSVPSPSHPNCVLTSGLMRLHLAHTSPWEGTCRWRSLRNCRCVRPVTLLKDITVAVKFPYKMTTKPAQVWSVKHSITFCCFDARSRYSDQGHSLQEGWTQTGTWNGLGFPLYMRLSNVVCPRSCCLAFWLLRVCYLIS